VFTRRHVSGVKLLESLDCCRAPDQALFECLVASSRHRVCGVWHHRLVGHVVGASASLSRHGRAGESSTINSAIVTKKKQGDPTTWERLGSLVLMMPFYYAILLVVGTVFGKHAYVKAMAMKPVNYFLKKKNVAQKLD
jgi:hypothetical protein